EDPTRPLVVVLGGAKVVDKIALIERFLEIADVLLIGGAMCFSFFRAQGKSTGDSLVDETGIDLAREALLRAEDSSCRLLLPTDLVIADSFDAGAKTRETDDAAVPTGWIGLDVGPRTREQYAIEIAAAGTVFWNGPMGAFELEPFAAGTGVEVGLCVPFTALAVAVEAVEGSGVRVLAQNMHQSPEGPFTGEVSAPMLLELGVHGAVLGHSERRRDFGETDRALCEKVQAALEAGLGPILCVGETEEEREAGETQRKLRHQVQEALQR